MFVLIHTYSHELDDDTTLTLHRTLSDAQSALTAEVRMCAEASGYEFREDDANDFFGIDLTRRNDMRGIGYVNDPFYLTWAIYESSEF